MAIDERVRDKKSCKTALLEGLQYYYCQVKSINMNILQVNKFWHLVKIF